MDKSKLIQDRVGTVGKNNFGSIMIVEKFNNFHDILVRFEQGNLVHTRWQHFKNGMVKNPYDKSVFGVGYIGEGQYKSIDNGKNTPQYKCWNNMLLRNYDEKKHEQYPNYKDCTVSAEWHNFQNFAKWYDENFYHVKGQRMHLDKDILVKGNKIYSPDTCVFVPSRINSLFAKRNSMRGDLPIGVTFLKERNSYIAACSNNINGKRENLYLGCYDNPFDAHIAYKIAKENLIKELASEYKDKIPSKLYEAMINYTIEITD